MFIPRNTRDVAVAKCVCCRWCHGRSVKKQMFCVRDGPIDRWFCDAECSLKFTEYRLDIGTYYLLKMGSHERREYLKGMTIEEFISNGMKVK